jgi:hypothetical protein
MKHGESIESLWLPLQGTFQDLRVPAGRRFASLRAGYELCSHRGINENL